MSFTLAQYNQLSAEDRLIVQTVCDTLHGDGSGAELAAALAEPEQRGGWRHSDLLEHLLCLLGPCDGCVPESYVENLTENIILKLRGVYASARTLAATWLGVENPYDFEVVIQPDYEDSSTVVVIAASRVLLNESTKVWNIHFDSLADLARTVRNVAGAIVTNYRSNP